MSALEQKVNSGQISDVSLQISEQMPGTFSDLARKHQVPGAQFAIYHGGSIVAHEIGELKFGTGLRVTRDAVFPIGSITKFSTATVAMILVADGDVDLDAPIRDYVPETGDLGEMISLRQLLSHTSGLAESSGMQEKSGSSLRHYLVEHVRGRNLVLPPGTGFSYSNPGYIVAGRLIETVTGMSWAEAVESILLRPLGIQPAFVTHGTMPPRRQVATGHSVNTAGKIRPVRQEPVPAFAPAGALAVSAVDLVKLGLIHVRPGRPGVLPAAYARQMRQAVPRADPFGLADGWGLGLAVYRQQSAEWAGHDGNASGTSCYVRINPADGWVVALTSNSNTGAGLWQEFQAELARVGVPIDPPRIATPDGPQATPPRDCAGQYTNGDIQCTVKAGRDGAVYLSADGENFDRLTFFENLTFTFSAADLRSPGQASSGRFVRDPATGMIYGIHVSGRLARRRQQVVSA